MKAVDITGEKFGKLTALYPTNERKNKEVVWICECECGNITKQRSGMLRSNRRFSCGCAQYDHLKGNIYNEKHGHTKLEGRWKSPTYRTWCKMKDRCLNPDKRMAQYYNKEMLCERWYQFENFLEDMGKRPDGCEIHRIDNDKGYEPNNCEWKDRILHRKEHTNEM